MKVFRTLDDVERACLPDGLFQAIHDWLRELIECHEAAGYRFDPDADGYSVLVEEGDTDDAVRAAPPNKASKPAWALSVLAKAMGVQCYCPHGQQM